MESDLTERLRALEEQRAMQDALNAQQASFNAQQALINARQAAFNEEIRSRLQRVEAEVTAIRQDSQAQIQRKLESIWAIIRSKLNSMLPPDQFGSIELLVHSLAAAT
jgi:hypothetical protein